MAQPKDSLGDRIKSQYEKRSQTHLPRRTYTVIRLDGKAFHSYTRGLERPFDLALMEDMDLTAKFLCENIQGCKMAYVQSDEISLVLTDFDDITTEAYFDGNVQKITSISASMAAAKFNQLRRARVDQKFEPELKFPSQEDMMREWHNAGKNWNEIDALRKSDPLCNQLPVRSHIMAEYEVSKNKLAFFDSRVFTIPDPTEVENYLIWRQQDATRNSIQMAAQSMYSHKQLHGKNTSILQDMMMEKDVNWNDYPDGFKRGRCVVKENYQLAAPSKERALGKFEGEETLVRSRWVVEAPPIFTKDREYIRVRIPRL